MTFKENGTYTSEGSLTVVTTTTTAGVSNTQELSSGLTAGGGTYTISDTELVLNEEDGTTIEYTLNSFTDNKILASYNSNEVQDLGSIKTTVNVDFDVEYTR